LNRCEFCMKMGYMAKIMTHFDVEFCDVIG